MVDNEYSIKRASQLLDCTTQNIYRQKATLIQQGMMAQDSNGDYYINTQGINYLREKRIKTMKENSSNLSSVDNKELSSVATPTNYGTSAEIIEILQAQIKDLKEEKDYWKKEYERKDLELSKTNEHLQNMNTTVFQKLLATEEENKRQAEEVKKGFWKRFFS